ncbi:glutathione S-transferase T3-like [Brassica rapa]|uniref:glutathione S-transferase T3-like n=1 Tax=Brassica campestris TaxID=3711 RepID=UPI00142E8139|nr:glutathione S-transferase T3-like [Brassica rapa]
MDPFTINSPGFTSLLASQSSPAMDCDFSEAVANSPGIVKPVLKRKWSTKEDLVLMSGWLNTGKDAILTGSVAREWSQCKQRWGRVNEQVCKFVGSYEAALKEQSSGENENDVMKAAHDIFFNDYHAKFAMEHCWRELRYDQKWKSYSKSRDAGKEKRKENEEVMPEEEVRPAGVKAAKASKRKRHRNEAAFDQIESILAARKKISQQKLLDRLLAKNDTDLSPNEISLKNKLVSELLD